jgi:hypothetical protein
MGVEEEEEEVVGRRGSGRAPAGGHGHRREASVEGLAPGWADVCVTMGVVRSGPLWSIMRACNSKHIGPSEIRMLVASHCAYGHMLASE